MDLVDRLTQIWLVRTEDGQGFRVTEAVTGAETRGDTFNSSPCWSPDSRSLYFISDRGGSRDLWRRGISKDGAPTGELQRITTGLEMLFARFSPDGKHLVYSKGRRMGNVWRVPILETRLATWPDAQQLTYEQSLPSDMELSPDRTQLLLRLLDQKGSRLWTMPAEGGVPRRVLMDPMQQVWASWSPDGKQIVFHSNEDIWVVPADGGPAGELDETRGTGPGACLVS